MNVRRNKSNHSRVRNRKAKRKCGLAVVFNMDHNKIIAGYKKLFGTLKK